MPTVNPEQIKRTFAGLRLYKQAGAVKPLTVSYPGHACLGFTVHKKRSGQSYTPFGWYLYDDYFDVYFPRDTMLRIGWWYYAKEQRDRGFIAGLKRQWERMAQLFFGDIHAIERVNLRALSQHDLLALFHEFSNTYDAVWREAIFLDAFDVSSEEILDRERQRVDIALTNDELSLLAAPTVLSTLQRERQALFRFASKKGEPTRGDLEHHADAYHWIYNDYAVIKRLDWRFFLRAIRASRKHPTQWKKEAKIIAHVSRIAREKQQLIRAKKLPTHFVRVCTMLATLAEWRDLRKAMNQRGNAIVKRFAQEFARRSGLTLHEVEYIWWWEMKDFFRKIKELKRLARKRMQGVLIYGDRGKNCFVYGKNGKTLHCFLESTINSSGALRGRTGYPGIVRGTAKIILSQRDFKKMKRGDILVAPNTRPEYVPIMKIASAIISEEGGLTCHSAIVARELKIPAIVGVQGAIAALKDGDEIEVDAEHGVVRKI